MAPDPAGQDARLSNFKRFLAALVATAAVASVHGVIDIVLPRVHLDLPENSFPCGNHFLDFTAQVKYMFELALLSFV